MCVYVCVCLCTHICIHACVGVLALAHACVGHRFTVSIFLYFSPLYLFDTVSIYLNTFNMEFSVSARPIG